MPIPNILTEPVAEEMISRINKLNPSTTPQWGKMNVGQMLAHCNLAYDMQYTDKYPKPNFLVKWMLKSFVKNDIVSEKPYKRNSPTAPAFKMTNEKDFETEKQKLIDNIRKTQQLGEAYWHDKESHSFGKLTKTEWNNMFQKHLNHHLAQFGV